MLGWWRTRLLNWHPTLKLRPCTWGCLGCGKVARGSGGFPGVAKMPNVVLDPILKSSSGADLVDAAGVRLMTERLLPLAAVVTPNIDEASTLTGMTVTDTEQMRAAARKLHEMGAPAVVITGGHLEKAIDLLSFTSKRGIEQEVFKSARLKSNSTHGTGCAFATSVACHLALGRGLPEAVLLAKGLCCGGDQSCASFRTRRGASASSLSDAAAAPGFGGGSGAGGVKCRLRLQESLGEGRGRNLVSSLSYFLAVPACFSNIPATNDTSAASSHCIRQD